MKSLKSYLLKSIIAIAVAMALPLITIGGQYKTANDVLYDGYGQSVVFSEITNNPGNTIVVFWESNDPRHTDFLEELETLRTEMSGENEFKIIAICTDRHHNKQQIISMVSGNDWKFDVYVDVNRAFARKYGLNNDLHTLFFVNGEEVAEMSSDKASAELIVDNYIMKFHRDRNSA